MRALVTGAGGFIGFYLTKTLVKKGHTVRGLLMPQENGDALSSLGVDIRRGDLTKPETLKGITADIDIIFHLATRTLDWGSKKQFEAIMVGGTKNLLADADKNTSRFVYFSSIAAFGLGRDLVGLNEESEHIVCGIPYCDTKIIAEDLVKDVCKKKSIPYTIIRPANVIGPGSVWIKEILDAFHRGPFPLVNGGKDPCSFVYINNLVDGTILASESKNAVNRTYLFRDEYPITWKEYLNTVGGWVGKKTLGSLPFWLAWSLGAFFEKICTPFGIRPPMTRLAAGVMGRNNDVDNSRCKQELGWRSQVPLHQAMDEIQAWVQKSYAKGKT